MKFSGYLGGEVRAEAARQGLSVAALARQMSTDRLTLVRYLSGERAFPVDTLYMAAVVLDCDPDGWRPKRINGSVRYHPEIARNEGGVVATGVQLYTSPSGIPLDSAALSPGCPPRREEAQPPTEEFDPANRCDTRL